LRPAVFLFVCCLAACAGSPLRAGENARSSTEARSAYLEELFSILDETTSPDAFMLTLRCLDDDKADPRVLIPIAIRNAERLGILRDHGGKEGRKVERAETFAEVLEHIHKRMDKAQAVHAPVECSRKKSSCEYDCRTPVIPGYNADGTPPTCGEPPADAAILRKMGWQPSAQSWLCQTSRDDVQIVKELVKDEVAGPRFFPLVGPARLHHCHWKCTVSYNETVESTFPFPCRCVRPRVEVVYVDADKLYVEQELKGTAE
jgi:hypothetical protein